MAYTLQGKVWKEQLGTVRLERARSCKKKPLGQNNSNLMINIEYSYVSSEPVTLHTTGDFSVMNFCSTWFDPQKQQCLLAAGHEGRTQVMSLQLVRERQISVSLPPGSPDSSGVTHSPLLFSFIWLDLANVHFFRFFSGEFSRPPKSVTA